MARGGKATLPSYRVFWVEVPSGTPRMELYYAKDEVEATQRTIRERAASHDMIIVGWAQCAYEQFAASAGVFWPNPIVVVGGVVTDRAVTISVA